MSKSLSRLNESECVLECGSTRPDSLHSKESLIDSLAEAIENGNRTAASVAVGNGRRLAFAELCSQAGSTASDGDMYDEMYDIPCPFGSICEGPFQISWQYLQELPRVYGIGDIHGGAYCPGNENSRLSSSRVLYENCEVGYYCPNTTTKIICPEGYFCPLKTAQPEIICSNCKAGSKTFVRNTKAFAFLLILPVAIFFIIVYRSLRRNKKEEKKKMEASGCIAQNSRIETQENDNIVDASTMGQNQCNDQSQCNEVGVDGVSGKQLAKAKDHVMNARILLLCLRRHNFLLWSACLFLLHFVDCKRTCVDVSNDEFVCSDDAFSTRQLADNNRKGKKSSAPLQINRGLKQRVDGTEAEKQATIKTLRKMEDYFLEEVLAKPEYEHVRHRCQNLNELCAFWVTVGECESNRIFMLSNCAAACRFCLLLNTDIP